MPDQTRLAIEANLANAEKLGDADRVKRIKARLSELDKAIKADAKATTEAVASTPAVKKAAKKTAKTAKKG